MGNRTILRRTYTAGKVPTILDLLEGELGVNVPDEDFYFSNGSTVIKINAASSIRTDSTHRFVSDSQISQFGAIATTTSLGQVQIGTNLQVDVNGVISQQAADATHTGALTSTDWATFNGKQNALGYVPVNVAGDTMLGALVLPGDPTTANQAANKGYVDSVGGAAVQKSGDTMTGLLILSADPAQNLGAATKQYVDNSLSVVSGTYAAPVQALVDLTAVVPGSRQDKQLRLVENVGAIYRYDVESVIAPDGDGVIAPDDITPPAPGRWIKVQAATQFHDQLLGLQGGAPGDYVHLTTVEKNGYDAHIADDTLHLTSAQNTWIDSINASATEVNYLVGVTSPIQGQLNGKQSDLGYVPVNKAGDTMTGLLILSGDPIAAGGAVPLSFLQNYTIDNGTF